jgi:hypothetical protein
VPVFPDLHPDLDGFHRFVFSRWDPWLFGGVANKIGGISGNVDSG